MAINKLWSSLGKRRCCKFYWVDIVCRKWSQLDKDYTTWQCFFYYLMHHQITQTKLIKYSNSPDTMWNDKLFKKKTICGFMFDFIIVFLLLTSLLANKNMVFQVFQTILFDLFFCFLCKWNGKFLKNLLLCLLEICSGQFVLNVLTRCWHQLVQILAGKFI